MGRRRRHNRPDPCTFVLLAGLVVALRPHSREVSRNDLACRRIYVSGSRRHHRLLAGIGDAALVELCRRLGNAPLLDDLSGAKPVRHAADRDVVRGASRLRAVEAAADILKHDPNTTPHSVNRSCRVPSANAPRSRSSRCRSSAKPRSGSDRTVTCSAAGRPWPSSYPGSGSSSRAGSRRGCPPTPPSSRSR